jgi:hypothetical protein
MSGDAPARTDGARRIGHRDRLLGVAVVVDPRINAPIGMIAA